MISGEKEEMMDAPIEVILGSTLSEDFTSSHVSNKIRNFFFFGAPLAASATLGPCRSLTDALPRFSPSTRPTLISVELTPSSMAPLWSIHRDPLWTQGDSAIGVTFR